MDGGFDISIPDFPPTDLPEGGGPKPDPFCFVYVRGSDEPFAVSGTTESLLEKITYSDSTHRAGFIQLEDDVWIRYEDITAIVKAEGEIEEIDPDDYAA